MMQIVRYGVRYGLIEKSGSYSFEDVKEQGEQAMGLAIMRKPELKAKLEEALLRKIVGK